VFEFAANCSTLFRDTSFLKRPERAHSAGFGLVEFWWPFGGPSPSASATTELVDALAGASVSVACMNLFAGDLGAGERGILNIPSRAGEFRAAVAVAASLSAGTGCRRFNALYGLAPERPYREWDTCAMDNLAFACESLAAVGAALLIEPLCRTPRFGLPSAEAALAVVDVLRKNGHANVGLLADLYQFAFVKMDVPRFIREHAGHIRHVQLADDPGRGAPGTGQAPVFDWLNALVDIGYTGVVGLEYMDIPGVDPFAWIPRWRATLTAR
jgi:hydroxypyruvate isomerase